METHKYKSVDEYLDHVPSERIEILGQLRNIIKETLPEAEEIISYNMPAYKFKKVLVYFALSKSHVGFYPTPSAIETFKPRLESYRHSKGAVQFPLDKPLPVELIKEICRFRFEEESSN